MQLAKVVIAGALMQDVQKDCLKVNVFLNMYSRCGYCIRYKTDFTTNFTSIHPSLSDTHNSLPPHNEPHIAMEGLKLLPNPLRLEYKQVRMFGGH